MNQSEILKGPEEIMERLRLPWPVIMQLWTSEGLPLVKAGGEFTLNLRALKRWQTKRGVVSEFPG
jgi:hypothetical protein